MRQALVAMSCRRARRATAARRGGGEAEDWRLERLLAKGRALIKTSEMKALNPWKARWAESAGAARWAASSTAASSAA